MNGPLDAKMEPSSGTVLQRHIMRLSVTRLRARSRALTLSPCRPSSLRATEVRLLRHRS
jgi:hypothetical protein